MIDKSGIYTLTGAEYHADPAPQPSLSAGMANDLDKRSPLHCWTNSRRLNPDYVEYESATFDLGSAAHAMLLEGGTGVVWLDHDDFRTKAAKEARDAARAENKMPILAKHRGKLERIATIARDRLARVMAKYSVEQSVFWQEGSMWCRARPDAMNGERSILVDYKTCGGSAEPDSWIRNHLIPEGHDIRAVHYLRGNHATGGREDAQYLFLVQEVEPPFCCSVIGLAPSLQELAERKWSRALRVWRSCLDANKWPGYAQDIAYAEAPSYALTSADEREIREGLFKGE
jgi:hypothetical protein